MNPHLLGIGFFLLAGLIGYLIGILGRKQINTQFSREQDELDKWKADLDERFNAAIKEAVIKDRIEQGERHE